MSEKFKILVLNGPNLNLLGRREPQIYGHQTLADIGAQLDLDAQQSGAILEHFQSNHEGEIVDRIHAALGNIDFILINPGALTHTSVALRDALLGVNIPFIEIHLSNIHAREPFRHHSYLSDKAMGVICGFGAQGYQFALSAAINRLRTIQNS
ncbi:type II 3-dehydroquinate dehydratase [Celerinatantimonas sp. YJH-8]|uniref:type II 3-dehydroquinate dehydratase n=1 Tax=Celerinatantimonas sp. YJH-8 TaxID=3228714 RepID=UPI0038C095FC